MPEPVSANERTRIPEQLNVSVNGLFRIKLKRERDCLTCKGSGAYYLEEDDSLHPCFSCGGTGGKVLRLPRRYGPHPQPHLEAKEEKKPAPPPSPPQPGKQQNGLVIVTWNGKINVPRYMRESLPFRPYDWLEFTPTDNGLEVTKADRSLYYLSPKWRIFLEPELMNTLSFEHRNLLRLTISGNTLLIEKVTMPKILEAPQQPVAEPTVPLVQAA